MTRAGAGPAQDTAQVPSRQSPAREPSIWLNGERVPADGAHVSARDRGLTLADGVFETMRVRNGRVFRLDAHVSRLSHALAALRIPEPTHLHEWIERAVTERSGADAAVRLTVTRGAGPGGVAPPPDVRPTVILTVSDMPANPPSIYEKGLSAHVASGRRNQRAMTAGLKTLSYTDSIAGLLEAQGAGADEALFLDTDDHCSEASASNLFAWTDDTLLTPPLSCGALPGITRAAILELSRGAGFAVAERPFGLTDLLRAREAFLTSSLRGIAPLVRVDASPIGDGMPGAMTLQLAKAYQALVNRECA